MKTHAFLIGLNAYKDSRIPPLTGCVKDINRFEDYLKKKLGLPAAQITKLTDKQVTKKAVIATFESFIKDKKLNPDDTFIFYFAGHGLRRYANAAFKNGDTLNDMMECLTCYDTILEGENLIADKELRWLIHRLYESSKQGDPIGAHILTIFDCCHSGDNTRAVGKPRNPEAERSATDRGREYIVPQSAWKDYIFSKEISEEDVKNNDIAAIMPQGRHIQLAACATNETAKEDLDINHGYFSTFLLEILNSSNGKISYYDLRSLMTRRLDMFEPEKRQTPQFYAVETSLFQPFLGGAADARVKAGVSFSTDRNRWEMTMGAIYGIPVGAKIFVDLGNGQTEGAEVKEVFQDYSILHFDIEDFETKANTPADKKRLNRDQHYFAIVDKFQQKEITVACADKKLAAAWDKFCKNTPALLELATAKPVATNANYVVNTEGGQFFVADAKTPNRPLAEMIKAKTSNDGFMEIAKQLRTIARWEFVKQQKTEPAADKLLENLSIIFTRTGVEQDLIKDGKVNYQVGDYSTREENSKYRIEEPMGIKITNTGGSNLYIAGAWLNEFFEIDTHAINANSIAQPLQPTKSFTVYGSKTGSFKLTFRHNIFVDKWENITQFVKIYVSTTPFEVTQLQQMALEPPRLVNRLKGNDASRGVEDDDDAAAPSWTVKTIELVLDTSKIV